MPARRTLLACAIAVPLGLSGCGWEPLYADRPAAPANAELRAIKVAPIPERIGQKLALALRRSLNPTGEPSPQRYLLRTLLQTSRVDLGVLPQGLGSRERVDVSASFYLSDLTSGAQLFSGTSRAAESFDILSNYYANVVTEEDSRDRTAEEIGRDIMTQLTLFMQRRAAEAGGSAQPQARTEAASKP